MNKIFLETKILIEGSLDLKNLSQVNKLDFDINELKKIKVLYKNKQKDLSEIFKIKIKKNKQDFNEIFLQKTNSNFKYIGYEISLFNRPNLSSKAFFFWLSIDFSSST